MISDLAAFTLNIWILLTGLYLFTCLVVSLFTFVVYGHAEQISEENVYKLAILSGIFLIVVNWFV